MRLARLIVVLALLLPGVGAAAGGPAASVADVAKAGDLTALRALLQPHVHVSAPEPEGTPQRRRAPRPRRRRGPRVPAGPAGGARGAGCSRRWPPRGRADRPQLPGRGSGPPPT